MSGEKTLYKEQIEEKKKQQIRELEIKVDKARKCFSLKKTLLTIILSFLGLMLMVFIYVLSSNFSGLLKSGQDFFYKGSLVTVALANIAGIISNLKLDDEFTDSNVEFYYYKKHERKKKKRADITSRYNAIFMALAVVLSIIYTVFITSNYKVTFILMASQIIFYCFNVVVIYKFNYYMTCLNKEKNDYFYKKFDGGTSVKNDIENGKNMTEVRGVEL